MKRDTAAFHNVHFAIKLDTLNKCEQIKKRLNDISGGKVYPSYPLMFDLGIAALEKELMCSPAVTVRLCLPKETDFIRVTNIDGVSHYQAYRIDRSLDASGETITRAIKVPGRGVLPYQAQEGRYNVK